MDWIKAHYEKCLLALAALLLIALSAFLFLKTNSFNEVFAPVLNEPPHSNKVEPVDASELERVQKEIQAPAKWVAEEGGNIRGALFVSDKYIIKDDGSGQGKPYNPMKGGDMYAGIPNKWFFDNHLDLLDPNVLNEDPDGDGFTNQEEHDANTNPNDKNSHPPYSTKLRLKEKIPVLFAYLFKSYDGDPKKPQAMEFQLNPVSGKSSSQFLKIGEVIPGTTFKVVSFELKKFNDANDLERDVSELKIQDPATNKEIILVLNKRAESPNSFGIFKFLIDGTEFKVQIEQTFSLPPEPEKKYKLLEIKEKEAIIEDDKTKEKVAVPHL
jgi:hypothetical protein